MEFWSDMTKIIQVKKKWALFLWTEMIWFTI